MQDEFLIEDSMSSNEFDTEIIINIFFGFKFSKVNGIGCRKIVFRKWIEMMAFSYWDLFLSIVLGVYFLKAYVLQYFII